MEYIKLLRPLQWTKNIFVFIPLVFAADFFVAEKFKLTFLAAIVFSLVASAMYIVNDLCDVAQDREHPTKKHRPLAAGTVPMVHAYIMLVVLLGGGALIISKYMPGVVLPLGAYVLLNLAYSFYLKHIALLEILIVSVFYVLRILAGGFATATYISSWLILCVIFLTVFITLGKRYAEFAHGSRRKVLQAYSKPFLEQLLGISVALTIVTYGIYSVLGVESSIMVYSIFFVLLAMFRYLHLVYNSAIAETPEQVLVSDKVLIATLAGWSVFVGYIFYLT